LSYRVGELQRSMRAKAVVGLDQDIHVRADSIAYSRDDLNRQREICAIDHAPGRSEGVKL
jgi:hypothetical protein